MIASVRLDEAAARFAEYDFGRPAQLGRESTRHLEAAFESFARLWSSQLTAKIRVRAHLALESVDLIAYEEYAQSLPGTTAMVTGVFEGRDESCVVQFSLESALLWVVQMMGGRTTSPPESRTFTPIELALVRNIMEGTFEHLHASLGSLLPSEPKYTAVQYNPQYMQVISAGAAVIVARYTMRLGDVESTATVMLPASTVVDRLAATGTDPSAEHTPQQTIDQVRSTPLELTLRLAPLTIGAGEVLDLAPGDLLRLPHAETAPFELVSGDVPIARATPGSRGSRLTCKITNITEETH
ncbi:flagellar motor switch protein FliM [uncultured Microbacterium sp.]|uniref:flagellar motor switch protein FliM n=1 Tax=uncultured Microbacterium sp. TaxID=191216 RepID=UPI0028D2A006|nr:flagellar motor switch protein FliM [uncultured Microbacterium sp.]